MRLKCLYIAVSYCVFCLSGRVQAQENPSGSGSIPEPVVCVVAHVSGFDTSAISLPAGAFYLIVRHLAGNQSLQFSLQDSSGAPVGGGTAARRANSWIQELTLSPGKYRLGEANHPQWAAEITVGGAQ